MRANARDEGFSAQRRLMIEQNAVAGVDPVGFAIIDGDPVCVKLGNGIGRAWIERRSFFLWRFLNETVELRCGSLIKPGLFLQPQDAQRFEDAQRAERVGIRGVFRFFERDRDVALGRQIVDLVRLHFLDDPDQAG